MDRENKYLNQAEYVLWDKRRREVWPNATHLAYISEQSFDDGRGFVLMASWRGMTSNSFVLAKGSIKQ